MFRKSCLLIVIGRFQAIFYFDSSLVDCRCNYDSRQRKMQSFVRLLDFRVRVSLEGRVMSMNSLKRETCYTRSRIKYYIKYLRLLYKLE